MATDIKNHNTDDHTNRSSEHMHKHNNEKHHHGHHGHDRHHHHHHSHVVTDSSRLTKAFLWGIGLNVAYVVAEAVFGFLYNSMGLLSDAGHNLSDVAALALSLVAIRLAMKKSDSHFTYGYKKSTILISLLNAVILFVAVGFIIFESIEKIITPQAVDGLGVAWIAGIGVIVNGATMLFFRKDQEDDLNVKGAYLHMLADALVSVGVVVSGIVIHFTDWYIIDPIVGLIVAVVIIISAWELLRESLRLAVDAVPAGISVDEIRDALMENPDVTDVHHIHIWAISTTENALTAHIKVKDILKEEDTKIKLKALLTERGISHSTLEFELADTPCCDDIIAVD